MQIGILDDLIENYPRRQSGPADAVALDRQTGMMQAQTGMMQAQTGMMQALDWADKLVGHRTLIFR